MTGKRPLGFVPGVILPLGSQDMPSPKHLGISCGQPWVTGIEAQSPGLQHMPGTAKKCVGTHLSGFGGRGLLLEQVGQVLEMAMPASPPCSHWFCRDPSHRLCWGSTPLCQQLTLVCVSTQLWNLHLGHTGALVTHAKEEWDQYTPYVAVPLLVAPHRCLQLVSEEADGELSQLAALLVGKRKDKLWK